MKMVRVKYRIDRLLLIGMLISITAYICSGEMISGSYFGLLLMICCFLIVIPFFNSLCYIEIREKGIYYRVCYIMEYFLNWEEITSIYWFFLAYSLNTNVFMKCCPFPAKWLLRNINEVYAVLETNIPKTSKARKLLLHYRIKWQDIYICILHKYWIWV